MACPRHSRRRTIRCSRPRGHVGFLRPTAHRAPAAAERGRSASRGETDRMALSARAKKLVAEITNGNAKLGDLKTRGKDIKKDHALAMELWSTGEYYPRLLAILVFDNKLLSEKVIDRSEERRVGKESRSVTVGLTQ